MMLRERRWIAAVLGLGLALGLAAAASGAGQAAKPKRGAPPDQAVQPDLNAPLTANPVPDPEPPPDQPATQPPVPAPAASQDEAVSPEKTAAGQPSQAGPQPDKPPKPATEQAAQTEPARPPGPPATPQQQQLQKETDRLVQLIQELKTELEKAGGNTLSLAALRKADEVQQLSRNLKERMKDRGQTPQMKAQ